MYLYLLDLAEDIGLIKEVFFVVDLFVHLNRALVLLSAV